MHSNGRQINMPMNYSSHRRGVPESTTVYIVQICAGFLFITSGFLGKWRFPGAHVDHAFFGVYISRRLCGLTIV